MLFSSFTSMSFAFIPGSSALMTTPLSFSKISTEGFHVVVDMGVSQSLPKKPPSRAGSVLNSRKGSHLMSDMVSSPFRDPFRSSFAIWHSGFHDPQPYSVRAEIVRRHGLHQSRE